MGRSRWLCLGLVGCVGLAAALFAPSEGRASEAQPRVRTQEPDRVLTVQIGGRFCEYRKDEVKTALADVWTVEAVEFLNDHGTLRVFYEPGLKSRNDVVQELERALSIGWFCLARVQDAEAEGPQVVGLLQLKR